MLGYLCFALFFWNANSAAAPFITPCKDGDNECARESGQAVITAIASGYPEFGVQSMDPLHVPLIKSDQGGLKLTFKDTILTGLKGCKIDSIKHDRIKGKQVLVLRCSMTLKGDYVLDGQLLILPVQGNGKYRIDIRDNVLKIVTNFSSVQGKDGKQHWKIGKCRESFQVEGGATFSFDNLFNGNKVLADPIIEFANTNWKDVMQEIAPPIVDTIVEIVCKNAQEMYNNIPAEDLYIASS